MAGVLAWSESQRVIPSPEARLLLACRLRGWNGAGAMRPSPTSSTSGLAGELFLEEVADVRRYKLVFEHLRAVAASPEASLSLVTSGITGR